MGELFVEGELLRDILTLEAAAPADRAELLERLAALTDRERQTLDALLDGFNGKEIAARLSVSLRPVENYQSSIYGKLRARTAVDLVRIAGRAGLVSGL
jgi:DNA-binding NarL/FixJ family response regulator